MNITPNKFVSMTCLASIIILSACSDNDDNNPGTEPAADDVPTSLLDETALKQLEGIWEHRGYGNMYAFVDNRTTWYTVTENTCLEITSFQGLNGLEPEDMAEARYVLEGDQLSLAMPGNAFVERFHRLDTLPARCDFSVAPDAQGVFDYVWSTFDEFYAFFTLRDVDWAAEYAKQSPRVGDVGDDTALFSLLKDLLAPIDDGHVVLTNGNEFYSPAVQRGSIPELIRGFEEQSDITDFDIWADTIFEQLRQAVSDQLDENSIRGQGSLNWGTANGGSTGYLFIENMADFALDADGEFLENASAAENLVAARAAMDQAMADLADTSRLVVDVRLNGGGSDAIALDFAARFASDRQLVISKTARTRDFESSPVEAWLEPPALGAYLNPVTLIIGADTASAAEIFAISMRQLPQVNLIGETTAGSLSDVLVKPLPNNWVVGLSNEVYLDAQGVSFEGMGVSPEIEIPVFRLADIQSGVDPALERALTEQ